MKTFQSFCRRMVPVLGLSLGLAVSPALAQDVAKPFVVPELQQWTATDGSLSSSHRNAATRSQRQGSPRRLRLPTA